MTVKPTERSTKILAALMATLGLALFTPSLASAAFTRSFLRQTTGTGAPMGTFGFITSSDVSQSAIGAQASDKEPGGLAVNAEGDLWVGNPVSNSDENSESKPPFKLDEFGSASGGFLDTLKIEGLGLSPAEEKENYSAAVPRNLVIDDSTGDFYITGRSPSVGDVEAPTYVEVFDKTGTFVKRFGPFVEPAMAIDNSTESSDHSAGDVYVARRGAIEKFNAEGKPENFSGCAECSSYVTGNAIGVPPDQYFGQKDAPLSIAVDSHGDIYTIDPDANFEENITYIDEFSPTGEFLHAFTGAETPGIDQNHEHSGWGGSALGIAVDPVSGHVLVSVSGYHQVRATGGPGTETSEEELKGEGAIDEFDASGTFLNQITETSQGHHLNGASAITVDSLGDVYVIDDSPEIERDKSEGGLEVEKNTLGNEHAVYTWGPGFDYPSVSLAEASGRTRNEATVSGTVNPEGQKLSACDFEVVPQSQFEAEGFSGVTAIEKAACVPSVSSIAADNIAHPVQARLTGLTSGTTYHYRLVATSEGALGGTSESEPLAFTAPAAARVDATSVSDISSRFAELHARVDPLGAVTSVYFEYSTDGVTWVSTPEVEIGSGGPSGDADASVVRQIGPLRPGTGYRFRVSAHSEIEGEIEASVGPEISFSTLPATPEGLPDGRAYELLTPANKGSAEDMFAEPAAEHDKFFNKVDVGYPSESGDEFLFEAKAAFGSFAASGHDLYVMRRSGEGWQTISLASSSLGVQDIVNPLFDPEAFSRVEFADSIGSGGQQGDLDELSLLGAPGGTYEEIHKEGVPPQGGIIGTHVVGASRDLSHLVLESTDHTLVPGIDENQDAESNALYEYADGELTLISVNPEESPFRCGAMLGQNIEGSTQGGGARHNAVSADGSKVFFTAPDPLSPLNGLPKGPGCWNGATVNAPQLYMHAGGRTIELSSPEAGVSEEGHSPVLHPSVYVGAAADGSKIFFLSETELTAEAAMLKLHDPELYECEIVEEAEGDKCDLTRLSAGVEGTPVRQPGSSGAHVLTVPAISEDGSAVYFTAFAALAPGASEFTVTNGGSINLYRYDTVTGRTVYVATVSANDYPGFGVLDWFGNGTSFPDEVALNSGASWYTTPDGRYLLFASTSEIAGHSTLEANHSGEPDCPGLEGEFGRKGHCDEVYRYDVQAAEKGEVAITCVSCDPSGALPESNAYFAQGAAGEAPDAGGVRAISNDGSYVFFDSADPLVKQADNHTQDVFEWEALGRGGCEQAEGCLHLIGSGDDPTPSFFLGMSSYVGPGGETVEAGNVFIGTHARLAPQDTDEAGDLYDARIGGGFPVEGGKGPCKGNACENPAPAPIEASPGSLTFSGSGNPTPEVKSAPALKAKAKPVKCRKGYVKSKGKCVKKPKKKPKKAKKSSDKRRAK